MTGIKIFLRDWMLPLAMLTGAATYIIYHNLPSLAPAGEVLKEVVSQGQRLVIAFLLFFQFLKTAPGDLRFRRWHLYAALLQCLLFIGIATLALYSEGSDIRILLECAMICFICPTASAAGVITERLGGKLSDTVTYLIIINSLATLLIPAIIPMVRPSADLGFWAYVLLLASKIFPLLIVPCLLAWVIRFLLPGLHRFLIKWSGYSFYVWGVGLYLAILLATKALMESSLSAGSIFCIVLVSLACTAIQFAAGHKFGGKNSQDYITAGQALGQKNTGFLIWLGYTYLTPVTSIAGGLYALWQNLYNSRELYLKHHATKEN